MFTCPNCRYIADLEADIDEPSEYEEWEDDDKDGEKAAPRGPNGLTSPSLERFHDPDETEELGRSSPGNADGTNDSPGGPMPPTRNSASPNGESHSGQASSEEDEGASDAGIGTSTVQPIPINPPSTSSPSRKSALERTETETGLVMARTPRSSQNYSLTRETINAEGVMTPRNDAGPFILDGRGSSERARSDA